MRRTLFDDDHEAFRASRPHVRRQGDRPARRRVERRRDHARASCSPPPAGQGFLGMEVPEEYGGGGVTDFRFNVVIAEEIQRGPDAARRARASTLHNDICLPYFLALLHRRAEGSAGCPASAPAS